MLPFIRLGVCKRWDRLEPLFRIPRRIDIVKAGRRLSIFHVWGAWMRVFVKTANKRSRWQDYVEYGVMRCFLSSPLSRSFSGVGLNWAIHDNGDWCCSEAATFRYFFSPTWLDLYKSLLRCTINTQWKSKCGYLRFICLYKKSGRPRNAVATVNRRTVSKQEDEIKLLIFCRNGIYDLWYRESEFLSDMLLTPW